MCEPGEHTCSAGVSISVSLLIGATMATLQGVGLNVDWRFLGGRAGGLKQTDK